MIKIEIERAKCKKIRRTVSATASLFFLRGFSISCVVIIMTKLIKWNKLIVGVWNELCKEMVES